MFQCFAPGTLITTSPRPNDSLAPAYSALFGPPPLADSFRRFPSGESPPFHGGEGDGALQGFSSVSQKFDVFYRARRTSNMLRPLSHGHHLCPTLWRRGRRTLASRSSWMHFASSERSKVRGHFRGVVFRPGVGGVEQQLVAVFAVEGGVVSTGRGLLVLLQLAG